jgi:hypothetical protein
MGLATQAAVRRFRQSENIDPTGQLNRRTPVALGVQCDATAAANRLCGSSRPAQTFRGPGGSTVRR